MGEREGVFRMVEIREEDTGRVLDFLRKFFFLDEPLNLCIGLLEDGKRCDELEAFCTSPIPEGLSLMAVSPSNEILGVCLNGVLSRDEEDHHPECTHPKFSKIVALLDRVSRESDVLARFPDVEKALDIKVASVHADYRGRGIAKALFDATKKMAKELGFNMVKVDCSSHFTALAVAKLGFHSIYSLDYKDHVDSEGRPIFEPEPPHYKVSTFVLRID